MPLATSRTLVAFPARLYYASNNGSSQPFLFGPHRHLYGDARLRRERHFDEGGNSAASDRLAIQFERVSRGRERDIRAFQRL